MRFAVMDGDKLSFCSYEDVFLDVKLAVEERGFFNTTFSRLKSRWETDLTENPSTVLLDVGLPSVGAEDSLLEDRRCSEGESERFLPDLELSDSGTKTKPSKEV
jgi:hypothetical protein